MADNTQEKIVNAYQIAGQGDFDHARMILEEALYESSDNIEAWLLMADLGADQDEARQCYQMVLEISPDNWIAQQRLKLLFSREGSVDKAVGESFSVKEDSIDFPVFDGFPVEEDTPEETAESVPWKVLVKDNRKFFIRLGLIVGGAFLLMVIAWVLSVGFMAWRLGYLVIGG